MQEPKLTKQVFVKNVNDDFEYLKNVQENYNAICKIKDELDLEKSQREELRKTLESEGAFSLREQMDLIGKKVEESFKGMENSVDDTHR